MTTNVDYPYDIDSRGRTACVDNDAHIRDLIEQVLFTSPGERVNRPSFGSGILQLVFAPNSDALAGATQATVQSALQQWLGNLIHVNDVVVSAEESELHVTVTYTNRRTQEHETAEFKRQV
jgi:phage baseplate assembly protein W